MPVTVDLLTSTVDDLPFDDESVDAAVSTMTYHEFASDDALTEVRRILEPDGRFVIADWAATGTGDAGPSLEERFSATDSADLLPGCGFRIELEAVRPETFLLITMAG